MDTALIILYILLGLFIGFVFAFIIAKYKYKSESKYSDLDIQNLQNELSKSQNELSASYKQAEIIGKNLDEIKAQLAAEREKTYQLNSGLSVSKTNNENLEKRLAEQKSELEQLEKRFKTEFENLANRILDEKSLKFTEQNKSNIDQILRPLNDKIKTFEEKVDKVYNEDIRDRATLLQQIKSLQEMNLKISEDANNLTKALKGESKTQGNWGEFILESILEKSGLVKDREYFMQESHIGEDGRRYQPDVIIKLPDDRHIIIDSKVSLKDYEIYSSSDNDEDRSIALKNHIGSIRTHIKNLSSKTYQDLYGLNSLDFIVMFMPIEPALSVTAQSDVNIWNEAFEKNIVIVSPSTLLATLRTISNIWKQEYRTRNVMEIAKVGGMIYEKFEGAIQNLISVGKKLDDAKSVYEESMKKMYTGKGNLVGQFEKLKELGAKTNKSLPAELLERAGDDLIDNE
ncbi:MAG: DNA recombination protein RmuC [Ignavibacteria bacterium]|nr:DNA recombination protein RmuC [Ignavibacteria bacterium]